MRVIAGAHRGRRLVGPRGDRLRPTSDRVKEALFSILGQQIVGAQVVDLYAGTGALGIEALSRGAAHVTFVEEDRAAAHLLGMNLDRCHSRDSHQTRICLCRVEAFLLESTLLQGPYDIVLADPPYAATVEFMKALALAPDSFFAMDALIAVEHATKVTLPPTPGSTVLRRRYEYGDTALSLFHHAAAARQSS